MKLKINTKSSTESELVGVDQSLNFLVWLKIFFEHQMKEYRDDKATKKIGQVNVLLQDNTSAIQLERHGKNAGTKRTIHLTVQYYCCSSLLNNGTIPCVEYCATKSMIRDFMSKPLQGSLFRKNKNMILDIDESEEAYHHRLYHERKKGLK